MIRKLSTQLREKNAQNHNTQEAYQDRDSGHPNTAKPDTQIIKMQPEPSKIQDPQYTKRATATAPKTVVKPQAGRSRSLPYRNKVLNPSKGKELGDIKHR